MNSQFKHSRFRFDLKPFSTFLQTFWTFHSRKVVQQQLNIEINWMSVSASYVLVHKIPLFFELLALRVNSVAKWLAFAYQVHFDIAAQHHFDQNHYELFITPWSYVVQQQEKKTCKRTNQFRMYDNIWTDIPLIVNAQMNYYWFSEQ